MEIVINRCYGGFNLSPTALLWMYEHGCTDIAEPASQQYDFSSPGGYKKYTRDLKEWNEHIEGAPESHFLTVFSPDGTQVLWGYYIERNNPILVECVKTLGEKANGSCSQLKIVTIPDDVNWEIDNNDGMETIEETHRRWY